MNVSKRVVIVSLQACLPERRGMLEHQCGEVGAFSQAFRVAERQLTRHALSETQAK
jgi:hypothetical protein